jgi:hypothetical protein
LKRVSSSTCPTADRAKSRSNSLGLVLDTENTPSLNVPKLAKKQSSRSLGKHSQKVRKALLGVLFEVPSPKTRVRGALEQKRKISGGYPCISNTREPVDGTSQLLNTPKGGDDF